MGLDVFVGAAASGAVGALGTIIQWNTTAKAKLDKRFEKIEDEFEAFKTTVLHDYVLKEDFLREMQAVHNKLDRILDYLMTKPSSFK
jgi:hypothetical protein